LDEGLLALISGLNALPAGTANKMEAVADEILRLAPAGPRSDDTAVIVLGLPPIQQP
jgi:hypothetical protein